MMPTRRLKFSRPGRRQKAMKAEAAVNLNTTKTGTPVISNTGSPLLSLPIELFVRVTGRLPPESVAALTLTCHRLYDALFPTLKLGMDQDVKIRFLQLLERQFPGHYLCHACATYHAFAPADQPRNYTTFEAPTRPLCKARCGHVFYHHYRVRIRHVRLAVQRAELGSEHGMPLEAFTKHDRFRLGGGMWMWHSFRAHVIDGELVLLGTFQFHDWEAGPASWKPGVMKPIEEREWRVCPHVAINAETKTDAETGDDLETLLLKSLPRAHMFGPRGWRFGQGCCEYCYTDYTFNLYPQNDVNFGLGLMFAVFFYKNLGDGRSPEDPKWRNTAETDDRARQEQQARKATDFGKIYQPFKDADEVAEERKKNEVSKQDMQGQRNQVQKNLGKAQHAGQLCMRARKGLFSAVNRVRRRERSSKYMAR